MKVSVVVPCYNVEVFLETCLQTLLAQSLKNCEFIFVDDGSSDATPAILDSFKERDPRVRVIHQANKGLGGARNTGIETAQGEYIGFLDADDMLSENYFEALYTAAKSCDADIAWTNIQRFLLGKVKHKSVDITERRILTEPLEKVGGKSNRVVDKIYRRTLFDNKALLFQEHRFYEDIFFSTPVLLAAKKVVTVPEATYYYVYNPNSITKRRQDEKLQKDRYESLLFVRNLLKKEGLKVPRHLRQIRKKNYSVCGLSVVKVKDCGEYDVVKLFDVIPVWWCRHRHLA